MFLMLGIVAGLTSACSDGETAVIRGDRLWADSEYTAALAEYRLAVQQSGGGEEALIRVAHGYARTGDFERAKEAYDRLLARAPEYTDQAIYDYLTLARRARERGDEYGMARAVEAALSLRPGLALPELSEALAEYYRETGEAERALRFYQRALAHASPEDGQRFLYPIGELLVERGDCRAALDYFRAYREKVRGAQADEAAWHMGNCAFRQALELHQAGLVMEAMDYLELVVELGVPENVQDQAWFRRGELLYALGRFDEALEAYRKVLELNPARTGRLVERAQERIDRIRFGT